MWSFFFWEVDSDDFNRIISSFVAKGAAKYDKTNAFKNLFPAKISVTIIHMVTER
jgi:hypothetical protein